MNKAMHNLHEVHSDESLSSLRAKWAEVVDEAIRTAREKLTSVESDEVARQVVEERTPKQKQP
jgi:hypothetical protein